MKNALRGIRAGLLIQLASTSSIALCLLLVGLAMMGLYNLDRITRLWGRGTQVIIYLKPEAPQARIKSLYGLLQGRPEVDSVRWISCFKVLPDPCMIALLILWETVLNTGGIVACLILLNET